MGEMRDLFDQPEPLCIETPASHRDDPDTSRIAEQFVTKTGARKRQQDRTIEAVRKWPGKTSAELARLARHVDEEESAVRTMLGRRLKECETAKAVRRGVEAMCTVKHSNAITWWPL